MKTLAGRIDKLVESYLWPAVYLGGQHRPIWRLTALSGSLSGICLPMFLAFLTGSSPWIAFGVTFFASLSALCLAMAYKVIYGYERYTFYHYQVAILLLTIGLLNVFHLPILTYLDLVSMGLATALTVGRLGCFMTGCCHGRPHHWGVCYKPEHAKEGFPYYLVGVRLLPVQAIESIWVLIIVVVGSFLVLSGAPAGTALTWYVVAYGLGRFMLEFLRGDPERPYRWGFSEAQWTSVIVVIGIVVAEFAGLLPFSWLHAGGAATLAVTLLTVSILRRMDRKATHKLLHPRHIREISEAIRMLPVSNKPTDVRVACTSLDICISASMVATGEQMVQLYTLSAGQGTLKKEAANIVAGLIRQLTRYPTAGEMVEGENGLYHLVLPQTNAQPSFVMGIKEISHTGEPLSAIEELTAV